MDADIACARKIVEEECLAGRMDIVQIVIDHGLALHPAYVCPTTGMNILHWACIGGHLDLVRLIAEHVPVDVPCAKGFSPLHLACRMRFNPIVTELLWKGADVNSQSQDGTTPLMLASSSSAGSASVAATLLSTPHILVDAVDQDGRTSLYRACNAGNMKVVKLLTAHGAKVSTQAAEKWTPLHAACYHGHVLVVNHLLEHGACPTGGHCDLSPLALASGAGKEDCVLLLLNSGINPDFPISNHGNRPLHRASAAGHVQVVRALVGRGADINAANRKGQTALLLACTGGHLDTAIFLLAHGAHVHVKANYGNTALHIACYLGNYHLVRELLRAGSCTSVRNKLGWTPHDCAKNSLSITVLLGEHDSRSEFLLSEYKHAGSEFLLNGYNHGGSEFLPGEYDHGRSDHAGSEFLLSEYDHSGSEFLLGENDYTGNEFLLGENDCSRSDHSGNESLLSEHDHSGSDYSGNESLLGEHDHNGSEF